MDAKVKEFLETAKAKEREAFEKKRDEHLISLGLINEEESVREYSEAYNHGKGFVKWDAEQQKYYKYITIVPVSVSDEEYAEIQKVSAAPTTIEDETVENGAEKFLGVINGIVLVVSIIAAVILALVAMSEAESALFFIGLGVLLVGLISWAIVKVMLNISNNLHEINSKLK